MAQKKAVSTILSARWQQVHHGTVEITDSVTSEDLIRFREFNLDGGFELYKHVFMGSGDKVLERDIALKEISHDLAMEYLSRWQQQWELKSWTETVMQFEEHGYLCINRTHDEYIIQADESYYHMWQAKKPINDPKNRLEPWWKPAKPHKKRKQPKSISQSPFDATLLIPSF